MQPSDLEAVVHRALVELPWPPAPDALLPRVMAAARRERRKTWYLRPRTAWPRGLQPAAAVVMVALVWLAGSWWARSIQADLQAIAGARILWQVFIEPNATALVVLTGAMGATCAASCAALIHILYEGSSA